MRAARAVIPCARTCGPAVSSTARARGAVRCARRRHRNQCRSRPGAVRPQRPPAHGPVRGRRCGQRRAGTCLRLLQHAIGDELSRDGVTQVLRAGQALAPLLEAGSAGGGPDAFQQYVEHRGRRWESGRGPRRTLCRTRRDRGVRAGSVLRRGRGAGDTSLLRLDSALLVVQRKQHDLFVDAERVVRGIPTSSACRW